MLKLILLLLKFSKIDQLKHFANLKFYFKKNLKLKKNLELSGIEPEAFRMRNGRSTTELQPHVCTIYIKYLFSFLCR
jgi:hypothetical protein